MADICIFIAGLFDFKTALNEFNYLFNISLTYFPGELCMYISFYHNVDGWCNLYLTRHIFPGFTTWQVAFYSGQLCTSGLNLHTVIQVINCLLALLIMLFTYTFNYYYLKRKHSPVILQAEEAHTNKTLYSYKKLMFVVLMAFLSACPVLLLQIFLPENTSFPFNLYISFPLTLSIWNIAWRRKIINYFRHRVHQQTAGWPEFRFGRTRRVQPQTSPEEIEMHVVWIH